MGKPISLNDAVRIMQVATNPFKAAVTESLTYVWQAAQKNSEEKEALKRQPSSSRTQSNGQKPVGAYVKNVILPEYKSLKPLLRKKAYEPLEVKSARPGNVEPTVKRSKTGKVQK